MNKIIRVMRLLEQSKHVFIADFHFCRLAQSRLSDHDSLPDTKHWLQIY